ncbi:hypothetical protein [Spirillospora sp. NPDC047279]|uniref:hypothetical protein n=1 Tax=Spirillospora sp. NPDC047279 TaxID=3155478 RepID=UPI0033F5E862
MAPDPDKIEVAISSLYSAGREWTKQSGELKRIANNAASLEMNSTQMGLAAPVRGVYEKVRAGIQARLLEGAQEAAAIGKALEGASIQYRKEEQEGVHRIKKIW